MKSRVIATFVATIAMVGGCAPFATYPPVEYSADLTTPLMEPFPTLMAESIWYANMEFGTGAAPFYYNLPPNTPFDVYLEVNQRLGDGVPMEEPDQLAYTVESVRARGIEAEVDVIYPHADGHYELATIYFNREMVKGWRVNNMRRWRIPQSAPAPAFVPATDEQLARAPRMY